MKYIFVIQDGTGYVISATCEESEAIRVCKENAKYSYREIPFFYSENVEIHKVFTGCISDNDFNRFKK